MFKISFIDGLYFVFKGDDKVSIGFKDEKMALLDKENTWLLCSIDAIVWVIGMRADERFKVENITNTILKIELI